MSKTGKIISTIILSIVIILLIGVLVWGITGWSFGMGRMFSGSDGSSASSWRSFSCNPGFVTISGGQLPANAEKGLEYEVSLAEIKGVDLSFIHEDIQVETWDKASVRVEQSSSGNLADEDIMRFGILNGKFMAQSGNYGRNMMGMRPASTITLYVPANLNMDTMLSNTSGRVTVNGGHYRKLQLSSISGEVTAQDIVAQDTNVDSTSARLQMQNITTSTLEMQSTSGDINASGIVEKSFGADTTSANITFTGATGIFDANTVSGTVQATVETPRELSVDTASGSVKLAVKDASQLKTVQANTISGGVTIQLPENDGFTLSFDSISGKLNNQSFEMLGDKHGNGHIDINVDTASGSLNLEQI